MVKKKKKKYIKIKIRCYTLKYIKKISLGEYSSIKKKKPFQSR